MLEGYFAWNEMTPDEQDDYLFVLRYGDHLEEQEKENEK